jgi:hypothetical protein
MAVTNFIQTIWSKKIQDDLELKTKLVDNCLRDYEGDCKYARTVKILGVGEPTIGDYIGQDIDIEEMTDSSQDLVIDVQKYFAFEVKDVDKAQSVPGLPEKYQQKAMRKLALHREKFIGALVAGKAQSSADAKAGNDTFKPGATHVITASGKTKGNIKTALDDAIVMLRENNFDDAGVIEIDPRTYKTFTDELIELKTANDELIKRGVVGQYDTYDVSPPTMCTGILPMCTALCVPTRLLPSQVRSTKWKQVVCRTTSPTMSVVWTPMAQRSSHRMRLCA